MKKNQAKVDHGKSVGLSKKRWVILGLSLLFMIISLTTLFFIAENSAEKKLLEWVNHELYPNSEIVIDDFSFTLLPLGVSIKGISLLKHQPIDQLTTPKLTDAIRELSIEEISLSGVKFISLINRDQIQLKKFELQGVYFEAIHLDSMSRTDTTSIRDPMPISVSEIQFSDLNLKLFDTALSDSSSSAIKNLAGKITDFHLSDPSQFQKSTFEEMEIEVEHVYHFTENGFYEVSLDSFRLDTNHDQITFTRFHMRPLMNAYEIAMDIGYPIDNYDFQIPDFKIERMDLSRWLSDEELIAGKITLTDPVIAISRDKSLPRRERADRLLPHLQFKNLPFSVDIDTIHAENGTLSYSEEVAVENLAGSISFTEIDLSLYSMVNQSTDPIRAEAIALFMNQSDFDLNVEFSLEDSGKHSVSGNLYQLDLTSMNSTFENLVQIRLDTGEIQQLNFQFEADDDHAYGDLLLIYSDLDLRFIDAEDQTESGWDRVRSFIANTFVIRSNNTADDPRGGEIDSDRDKEKSIFNFWLRALSTGLIDTIKR